MSAEHLYANAFNQIPELGPKRLHKLHEVFSTWEEAWHKNDLTPVLEDVNLARAVEAGRARVHPEKEFELLEKTGARIVLYDDTEYPTRLRNISVPPQILYIQGTLPDPARPAVAVVGTRKATSYGLEVCEMLTGGLAEAGVAVVSGLARGIDAKAHESALDRRGYTAAVLGSGIDRAVLYPVANRRLADKIVSREGALLSEYPLTAKAARWMFPQRNRIVAGITDGTLVIEANAKSGALITANFALETGREVFAVPGQIFYDTAAGPNQLIARGAIPVARVEDILETLGIEHTRESASDLSARVNPREARILQALDEPKTRDEIIREIDESASEINQHVSILEIRGMIKNIGGGMYRRV